MLNVRLLPYFCEPSTSVLDSLNACIPVKERSRVALYNEVNYSFMMVRKRAWLKLGGFTFL